MNRFSQLTRLFYINLTLARFGIDRVVLPRDKKFHFITYFNPWNWKTKNRKSDGESIRLTLEALGPIFVKFGQALSTRADLLPADIVAELEKLQDQVPPFSGEIAKQIIETAFNKPIHALFAEFEVIPLASASIAQVHAATLHSGKKVVVKVLRPQIQKIIQRDIALLYSVAKLVQKYWVHSERFRPLEVVSEFEQHLLDELDMFREAGNASQLRRNFIDSDLLYIPEIHWPLVKKNVLVMERINGIAISDIPALKAAGVDLKILAEKGVEIFFSQVFRDCFFHADMHPGNIFVRQLQPFKPQYMAVDFGIVGSLSPIDQQYLSENLLAFFHRDYRRIVMLHIESGWVPANTRIDQFESAIRTVCEPIFGQPLKNISFGVLLMNLFHTATRFEMKIQPQLLLLQKTLLNVEGLGRQLYPDLDLWSTAKPYLEKWAKQQYSPKVIFKKITQHAPSWLDKMLEMPDLIHAALEKKTVPSTSSENTLIVKKRKKKTKLKSFFQTLMWSLVTAIWVVILFKILSAKQWLIL